MLPLFDENPTRNKPWVTLTIIAASLAVFVAADLADRSDRSQIDLGGRVVELPHDLSFSLEWAAIPCEVVRGRPLTTTEIGDTFFQTGNPQACDSDAEEPTLYPGKRVRAAVVISSFLHDGPFHLGLNMLFLWVFGNNVEDRLGHLGFLAFYLAAGIVGTSTYVLFQSAGTVAILGASGAVAGVMGSYLVWFPDAPIRALLFLILVDIRARWFLGGWFAVQFFTWTGPGAWIAHVAGFAFGVISGRLVRRYQPRLRLRSGQRAPAWDRTGGAGHGPYPHLGEVWVEPHHERYDPTGLNRDPG